MRMVLSYLFAAALFWCFGCGSNSPQSQDVQLPIQSVVEAADSGHVQTFYSQRGFEPAFVSTSQETQGVENAIKLLCRADQQGLNPASYLTPGLRQHVKRAYAAEVESDSVRARRLAELDVALASTLMEYSSDVVSGRVNPKEFGSAWKTPVYDIDPARVLAEAVSSRSLQNIPQRVSGARQQYEQLVAALETYREIAARGGWTTVPGGEAITEGTTGSRVEAVIRRLAATADLDSTMMADSTYEYTSSVSDAVSNFQERHGLAQDGIVGESVIQAMNVPATERVRQLELNLERWRWIPANLGGRYIYVNIPAFELHAFEGGSEQLSMRVVVGEEYNDRATPVFSDTMEYVVFNPYWNIPQSIASEEILPKARENPSYLAANNYEIVTGWGEGAEVVSASAENMDLVESGSYRLRQEPGPENSLGQIKFMFPNQFDIYLHDTPAEHLFDRADRAFSHGCIRVERPADLGAFVFTGSDWTAQRIRDRIQSQERSVENLESPVPVYILYWTAFVDSEGRVNFRNDLYGNDQELAAALAEQAPDENGVSCDALLALMQPEQEQ